jgi:hypothetical protein
MGEFAQRFLSFDQMIAGTIIKIAYYIGLVAVVLWTLFMAFQAFGAGQVAVGLGTLLIGLPLAIIYLRVICEVMIVLFRISDNLAAIRQLQEDEITKVKTFE